MGVVVEAVRARREGDVLIVSFIGLYTADAHAAVNLFIAEQVAKDRPRALVLNLLSAIHVMGEGARAGLKKVTTDAGANPRLPVALAVSPAMLEPMRKQCREMGKHGFLWVPFTDPKAALAWASTAQPVAAR